VAPATILLMRHAEKPTDKRDPHLSDKGRARAERLAAYIPEKFGKPDALFAAADKPGSRRPRETLEPLAAATGTALRHDVPETRGTAFAQELRSGPRHDGARVVVAWRHKALPGLARALGAKAGECQCPDPWPDGLYDLILRFDYDGAEPRVTAVTMPF
jgi:phosphohistidine phosphatase SixA